MEWVEQSGTHTRDTLFISARVSRSFIHYSTTDLSDTLPEDRASFQAGFVIYYFSFNRVICQFPNRFLITPSSSFIVELNDAKRNTFHCIYVMIANILLISHETMSITLGSVKAFPNIIAKFSQFVQDEYHRTHAFILSFIWSLKVNLYCFHN